MYTCITSLKGQEQKGNNNYLQGSRITYDFLIAGKVFLIYVLLTCVIFIYYMCNKIHKELCIKLIPSVVIVFNYIQTLEINKCHQLWAPNFLLSVINFNGLISTGTRQKAFSLNRGALRFSNADSGEDVDATCLTQANHATDEQAVAKTLNISTMCHLITWHLLTQTKLQSCLSCIIKGFRCTKVFSCQMPFICA